MMEWIETATSQVAITVISGVALTALFFLVREKLFPIPEVEGHWFIKVTTKESARNPYKNMILIYELMLWREGNLIKGTAEKAYEDSINQRKEFIGNERTRSQVDGFIDKRYFGKDRVHLHVVEQGHGRESTSFYALRYCEKDVLVGEFTSMVAKSEGKVELCKDWPSEISRKD